VLYKTVIKTLIARQHSFSLVISQGFRNFSAISIFFFLHKDLSYISNHHVDWTCLGQW